MNCVNGGSFAAVLNVLTNEKVSASMRINGLILYINCGCIGQLVRNL